MLERDALPQRIGGDWRNVLAEFRRNNNVHIFFVGTGEAIGGNSGPENSKRSNSVASSALRNFLMRRSRFP